MTQTLDLKALASPDAPDDLEWKVQRLDDGLWEAKASPVGLTGIIDATADGVLTLIPSVTGIVDEVQDVIEPGAYAETLKVRVPKGVWSHDWSTWVARTDDVKELLPGDSMLPTQWKGRPWPKGAGAPIVQATFNLGTQPGSEAYSNVKFFDQGPLGQQVEFSIGYRVDPARTTRDGKGWRRIGALQWFEWCPVLFGAMPLAGAFAGDERKTIEAGGAPSRERIVVNAPVTTVDRKAIELEVASAHWTPTEDELKAAHAADLEVKLAGREVTPSDVANTERLKRYWTHGEGGAKIEWGKPGDFDRCRTEVGKYLKTPGQIAGYCALRHHDATGAWPGHAVTEQTPGHKDLGADLEGKAWNESLHPRRGGRFTVKADGTIHLTMGKDGLGHVTDALADLNRGGILDDDPEHEAVSVKFQQAHRAAQTAEDGKTVVKVGPKHVGWVLDALGEHEDSESVHDASSNDRNARLLSAFQEMRDTFAAHRRKTEGKAAGSMAKATTHEPVGRKPLWKHKGWQLPAYIQHVANDLREGGKLDKSRAIGMAVGIIKNWAHGHDGKGGKVSASTRAAAAKALAEWTALKAKAGAERAAKAGKKGLDTMGDQAGTTELTDQELAELGAGLLDDDGSYDPDGVDDDPDDVLATGTEPDDPAYPTGDEPADEGKDLEGKAAAMKCGKSAKDCPHTHPGDTAYPIHDGSELGDAVAAYPRGAGKGGKTKASIRAHITRAARRLGKANKVPRNWPEKHQGKSFDEVLDEALEAKDYPFLPGSVEERQAELREALNDLLLPDPDPEGRRNAYVSLDATFADRVIATLTDYSTTPSEEQTFEIPYTYTPDDDGDGEVTFGDPIPKEKVVSLVDAPAGDDDGPGGPTQQAVGGDAPLGGANPLLPVARKLGTLAKTIEGALEYAAAEGKGLTGDSHVRRLRSALREVAGVAAGLGLDTDGAEALTRPAVKGEELDPEAKALLDKVDAALGASDEDLLAAVDAALADD